MNEKRANTAAASVQASIREVWASGSTIAELTAFVGITKDQFIRLRSVLKLPLRLDRSQRAKPQREHLSWQTIQKRIREVQATWDADTEYARRVVKNGDVTLRVVRLEDEGTDDESPVERAVDGCK